MTCLTADAASTVAAATACLLLAEETEGLFKLEKWRDAAAEGGGYDDGGDGCKHYIYPLYSTYASRIRRYTIVDLGLVCLSTNKAY